MIPKFRAWDKISGTMRYGLNLYNISILANSVSNQVFMQCTGAKDMHGTDIYKGDIIRKEICSPDDMAYGCYGDIGVVKYDSSVIGFIIDNVDTGDDGFYDSRGMNFSFNGIEIVGNIYETQEIL